VRDRRAPFAGAARGLCALAVLAGACGTQKPRVVDFSENARDYRPKDYDAVYELWTRHMRAMHQVDAALEVWATFKSWDFREAFVERYAAVYSLSDTDRTTLRRAQQDAFRRAYEFHVTAQSANYRWNDLDKASSAWRVTLIDALGHELTPEPVRVEKLPDAYELEFFPNRTPFSKSYSIRFPIQPDGDFGGTKTGSITLRIASPIARVDLLWSGTGG
jgi:hypothetical protein